MKKRILLTALLLPSLLFTFPASATDIVVSSGMIYENSNGVSVLVDTGQSAIIEDTVSFVNNSVSGNKATVHNGGDLVIGAANFEGNTSAFGAIHNWGTLTVDGATFTGNEGVGRSYAGAIYGSAYSGSGAMDIKNSTFTSNVNNYYSGAGAVYFAGDSPDTENYLSNSVFVSNSTHDEIYGYGTGGAVSLGYGKLYIDNVEFTKNTADIGGALYGFSRASNEDVSQDRYLTVENSTFTENKADFGGAIGNSSVLSVLGSEFVGNSSTQYGGAIYNETVGLNITTTISDSVFKENSSAYGGAIYTSYDMQVTKTEFTGNLSTNDGGAIYNDYDANLYIADTSFLDNSATGLGGAIYSLGTVNIEAKDDNIVFANNTASIGGNDIYMAASDSALNIKVADGKTVTFGSGVAGERFEININSTPVTFAMLRASTPQTYNGSVVFNSAIENATINVASGELHLAEGSSLDNSTVTMANGTILNTINNSIDDYGSSIQVGDDVTLAIDVYMAGGSADKFSDLANAGTIKIEEINPIGDTVENAVNFNLAKALGVDPLKISISPELQQETQTVLTPIRYLTGSIDARGNVSFAPTGNGYKDFNPAVMTSSVAAQLGGLFNQYNSYNQAFMNMDMRMQMNRQEREALRLKNSIASADTSTPIVYSPIFQPDKNKGGWMRGYSTFESVNMDGGPKVNNVMYGTFFGGDSDMQQLENGGEVQYSVYAGYNGSHQTYSGNSMWQNGGTMGVTGAYYKDNFFTALTANVGASVVDNTTAAFGKEDFSMLAAGIASKTGYNIELADGKFIIQPNYLMSYSFVNTFDYTNAAGVRIDSDPLHSIQIAPGVKFIGNLKNGWQPYASVRMVWNLMDKTDFTAANTSLPELSIKPWVEYGVGVQKRWGERFTGFAQTMLRSGGRNGVSLALGFRWAIGKAPEKNPNARNFTPELPKTKISLSR